MEMAPQTEKPVDKISHALYGWFTMGRVVQIFAPTRMLFEHFSWLKSEDYAKIAITFLAILTTGEGIQLEISMTELSYQDVLC